MKRFAFAAALVLLVGAAFSVTAIMSAFAAEETYPSGTQSVTIYPVMVGVNAIDSTQTYTGTTIQCARSTTIPNQIPLLKADLSGVPSGKAIVAAHLSVVTQKVIAGSGWALGTADIDVARVMSSWDSTNVTSSKRNATNQWGSDDILTYADQTADTTYSSTTVNLRPSYGTMIPDAVPAAGDVVTVDVTGLVRAWYSGLFENNGLALLHGLPEATSTSVVLHSSKATTPPYLTVWYTDSGGGGGTAGRGRGVGEGPR